MAANLRSLLPVLRLHPRLYVLLFSLVAASLLTVHWGLVAVGWGNLEGRREGQRDVIMDKIRQAGQDTPLEQGNSRVQTIHGEAVVTREEAADGTDGKANLERRGERGEHGEVDTGDRRRQCIFLSTSTSVILILFIPLRCINAVQKDCDLFHGKWVPSSLPLYYGSHCPYISQHQNCRENGRPDRAYEAWRWKPEQCTLPRFDSSRFLRVMAEKTVAFVGDSLAGNQFESLVCLVSQVETPVVRGSKVIQRFRFREHKVTLARMWSAWLVKEDEAGPSPGIASLHLDSVDDRWFSRAASWDVILVISGHWWAKPAQYVHRGAVVGGHLWKEVDEKAEKGKTFGNMAAPLSNVDAFRIATETVMRELATNFKGVSIFQTYSPDHYMGGEWNTGGSCSERTTMLEEKEVAPNAVGDAMLQHQLEAYDKVVASGDMGNKSRLLLMDIVPSAKLRADAHPGTFRSKEAPKAGRDGQLPPQDCLHWCTPGPIDTWNELLLQMMVTAFS